MQASLRVLADELLRPLLESVVLRAWKAVLTAFRVRALIYPLASITPPPTPNPQPIDT
jgi:hypothetical protein